MKINLNLYVIFKSNIILRAMVKQFICNF